MFSFLLAQTEKLLTKDVQAFRYLTLSTVKLIGLLQERFTNMQRKIQMQTVEQQLMSIPDL